MVTSHTNLHLFVSPSVSQFPIKIFIPKRHPIKRGAGELLIVRHRAGVWPLNPVATEVIDYPTPLSFNYFYSFGSLTGIFLVVQIVTGVLLAMHYVANAALAFSSVEHIMENVNSGWWLRYAHANGAAGMFAALYIHMARGIYYKLYRNIPVWLTGCLIFILTMAAAFIGYVLPWGQMSYWGATVITNLASAIPFIGPQLVQLLWGGHAVDNATLNRFFSLHYLVPILIAALAVIHLWVLHRWGSGNPMNISSSYQSDNVTFHPYFVIKDIVAVIAAFFVFGLFLFYAPNMLGHADNAIKANPLSTPTHIVPEWFFLPFYAMLRSCPDKIGGIITMAGALGVLFVLGHFAASSLPSTHSARVTLFSVFVFDVVLLGILGANPAEAPFTILSALCTVVYFGVLFLLVRRS
jgi:ubiquinol-cytochrome c reductase cytochrome b/c1 subunit